ncbi:MAG: hypothetical protein JHD05_01190 [Thermoleophilia bacterium]|nr:hypothetical protein [Thermoleophilia bacterium]
MTRAIKLFSLLSILVMLGVGLAACGGSSSDSSSAEETMAGAATEAAAPALTEYEQFAVNFINDPTNGFAPGFLSLTGNAAPDVPADIQCMVTTSGTDDTQVQVMLWSGTGEDYSVVILLTNGLEIMNTSTSSYGMLFGDAATSEEEFPPPTTGTPCMVASDWTISV